MKNFLIRDQSLAILKNQLNVYLCNSICTNFEKMRTIINCLLAFLMSWPSVAQGNGKVFNITAYGAKGDGKTLNTQAIQRAIDALSQAGGGRLIVPEGAFLTGSILLKSNVDLHLEKGAVLLGSLNPEDYQKARHPALVLAHQQENVSISGQGVINGRGCAAALRFDSLLYAKHPEPAKYVFGRLGENVRPQNIEMAECKGVTIKGITLKDAGCWVQTYHECENVVIDSIRVESDHYWNNDGIGIWDCRKVRIANSYVNSADDGICLKSYKHGLGCEDVVVENCIVRSSASALKFGTGSYGGFRNVTIRNISIFDTYRSAIAIECVDGGLLENVLVDGIRAIHTGNAIFIRLGDRNKTDGVSVLRNITIRNLFVQVPFGPPDLNYEVRGPVIMASPASSLPLSHYLNTIPSSITGIPGHPVENVTLENIEIVFPGRGNTAMGNIPVWRLHTVPEQEKHYPEFSMFGELPAWGMYVRHVKGLKMENVTVRAEKPDYRPAFVFDDVSGLQMNRIRIYEDDDDPQIILKEVADQSLNVDLKTVMTIP